MGYTFRFLKPTDPYYPQWAELRRRTKVSWIVFVAWAPVSLVVGVAVHAVTSIHEGVALVGAFVAGWLAMAGARDRVMMWPCPRCGNAFYRRGWFDWPFADNCTHCGLPEYARDADATG